MLGKCYLYALETLYNLYASVSTGAVTVGSHASTVVFDSLTPPFAKIDQLGPEPCLVHGPVIGDFGDLKGKKFEHAWIEGNEYVLDCGSIAKEYSLVPRSHYYDYWGIQPDECRRYTIHEVTERIIATGRDNDWSVHSVVATTCRSM